MYEHSLDPGLFLGSILLRVSILDPRLFSLFPVLEGSGVQTRTGRW